MKIRVIGSTFMVLALFSFFMFTTSGNAQTKPWVDGYYTGYGSGTIPTNQVDYSAMSVVIDFAVVVSSNGSLDATSNGVSSIAASSVAAAHAAGTKVIVSFGGAGDGSQIASAISSNQSGLVTNIVNFVKQYGYDGVDIDMEPVGSGIVSLVQALRAQLPSPTYIITATSTGDAVFGQCSQYLDQINLMTYDMAGNWQGWVSWYNGSLHTYGTAATNGSEASANCDAMVNSLTKAGVPASKIGIGSEFGGAVWSGVTSPNQTPSGSVSYDVPYNTIKGYGGTYTWDSQAQASYTVSSKGWATYDDTADVGAKMRYVQSKGLGGLIIWSLDMDHKTGTVGQDPLLNAVKANWGTSGTGDNVPPTISITTPSNGATISGTISFSANASDNVGVSSVIFKADGNQIGSVSVSPYTISYNTSSLSNGSHSLTATAYDAAGNSATATSTVTVSNAVKDTTAPTVAITSPANNSTVSGTVSIAATASDNVGVTSVQFKIDGSNLGSALTASPYTASWSTSSYANGSHTISAVASDAAGNSKTATATVTVSNAVKDTTAPTVAITSPANNSTVSGTVSITATASDNVGVTGVQFKIDGSNLGSAVTSSPYVASWSTTNYTNGSHTISAVANDAAGNSATSNVSVTVSNSVTVKDTIAPTVSITSPANNSTFSGTITISAAASDNVGVTSVQFQMDGSNYGSAMTASPYTMSCPTANYTNGSHTISAVASDAAGNKATSTVTVNFSNTTSGGTGGQASATDLWIYQNSLASGWSNGSWGLSANSNFNSSQTVYTGCTKSVKVVQANGGALRFLSGGWNALKPVNSSTYTGVSFVVYSTSVINLNVYLMGGPAGVTFPTVSYGSVPNGKWTTVTIPFSSLDPGNQTYTMLVIQDISGKSVTYYIDNAKLSGLPVPVLASPANGATNVASPVSLSWSPIAGATSSRIQVATDQNFTAVVKDTTVSSASAITLAGLQPATTYYWWVCVHEGGETSQWSSTWSFTTASAPVASSGLPIYTDALNSPWVDASWGATLNYSNTSPVHSGSYSISVANGPWGGASFHYGTWSSGQYVSPANYASVQFAVYSNSQTAFYVGLESDAGTSFPQANAGTFSAGKWNIVTMSMSTLNPSSQSFDRVDIMEESGTTVTYYLDDIQLVGKSQSQIATSVNGNVDIPVSLALAQNYPNPFNPTTVISFSLPTASHVMLKVYNSLGQLVSTLADGNMDAGTHNVVWDGSRLASGVYFYRMEAGNQVFTKKMLMIK